MNAVAGPRSASGTGRFNRVQGSGTWVSTGPSGIRSGVDRHSLLKRNVFLPEEDIEADRRHKLVRLELRRTRS